MMTCKPACFRHSLTDEQINHNINGVSLHIS